MDDTSRQIVRSIATRLLETLQWCDRVDSAAPTDDGLLMGAEFNQYEAYPNILEDALASVEWLALTMASLLLERPDDVVHHYAWGECVAEHRALINGLDDLIVEHTDISDLVEES